MAPDSAPTITIGAPVYNPGELLEPMLESLRTQSFPDFTVLIYDNASDDSTSDVARAFVARDARFQYVRQPFNKGALRNFHDCLAAARSPYFAWRAADDGWDARFLEVLHERLEAEPDKQLAQGRMLFSHQGEFIRELRPPVLRPGRSLSTLSALMKAVDGGWIYGLFRREAILTVMNRIVDSYGVEPWAFDYLALFPFLLDQTVVLTDRTWFDTALRSGPRAAGEPRLRGQPRDFDEMMGLRRRFIATGRAFLAERYKDAARRALGEALLWRYADRAYKWKHVARGSLKRAFGFG